MTADPKPFPPQGESTAAGELTALSEKATAYLPSSPLDQFDLRDLMLDREPDVDAFIVAAVNYVRDLLASPLAPTMAPTGAGSGGWLPIESAPKDGTWFVALENGQTYPCEWVADEPDEGPLQEGWFDHFNKSFENPTHWQPLPPPPAAGQDLSEVSQDGSSPQTFKPFPPQGESTAAGEARVSRIHNQAFPAWMNRRDVAFAVRTSTERAFKEGIRAALASLPPPPAAGQDLSEAPGHTDLMVSPESIAAFVEANPPPTLPDLEGVKARVKDDIARLKTSHDYHVSFGTPRTQVTPKGRYNDGFANDLSILLSALQALEAKNV